MDNGDTSNVDWVKALFDCSVDHAWITLRERVKSDFARWKELSGTGSAALSTDEGDRLIFTRTTRGIRQWVTVEIISGQIATRTNIGASSEAGTVRSLAPTVNQKSECRVLLDGKELEFWQASREILSPLLVG